MTASLSALHLRCHPRPSTSPPLPRLYRVQTRGHQQLAASVWGKLAYVGPAQGAPLNDLHHLHSFPPRLLLHVTPLPHDFFSSCHVVYYLDYRTVDYVWRIFS